MAYPPSDQAGRTDNPRRSRQTAKSDTPSFRSQVRLLIAPKDPVSDECKKLFTALRKQCPELFPADPLPAGSVGPEIPLERKAVDRLVKVAAVKDGGDTVLWVDGENELLVHASKTRVELDDGLVVVTIPVRCDQSKTAKIQVAFGVGDEKRPAGLIAATESRPRGPAVVVDVWGEALTAFAWQALLRVITTTASETGEDQDGAGLIPMAVTASPGGLKIHTMSRHDFDRVVR